MDQSVLWEISYGLYAVGVMDGERPTGCIVNTVFQVTGEPAQIGVSLNKQNYTTGLIEKNGAFSVSILSEAARPQVISALGFSSGSKVDKFSRVEHSLLGGLPIVSEGCAGYLLCRMVKEADLGSHMVIFAEVVDTARGDGAPPMTYQYYHEKIKGRAPKNAPTYQAKPAAPAAPAAGGPRYRCTVCGYIYEGELEKEPDSFRCPVCGAEKDKFVKL